ncbi:unnamed protein product [Acidithrix sp. C25]|nr:unnamed protein product [Acidithrix sp. C25]
MQIIERSGALNFEVFVDAESYFARYVPNGSCQRSYYDAR